MARVIAVCVVALCVAAACGGGASCPPQADAAEADATDENPLCAGTACGGEITGTWEFVASCGAGSGQVADCADGRITYLRYGLTGTLTIDGAGDATLVGTEDAAAALHVPLSCYGFSECSQYEPLFTVAFAGSMVSCEDHFAAGECAETTTATSCDCLGLINGPTTLTAHFATSGSTLTITAGTETIPGEYCVSGNELWIHGTRFGSADIRWRLRRM